MKKLAYLVLIAFMLSACGGGGDGGDNGSAVETTGEATGVWSGTITDGTGYSFDVVGIVSPENELQMLAPEENMVFSGVLMTEGDAGTGRFTCYLGDEFVFPDNTQVADGTMVFTYEEKSKVDGTYTLLDDNGELTLTYLEGAERELLPPALEGTWRDDFGENGWVEVIFASNGVFTGEDFEGCKYSGSIQSLENRWAIFDVMISVSECGDENGSYDGLAAVIEESGVTDMYVAASGEAGHVLAILVKQ